MRGRGQRRVRKPPGKIAMTFAWIFITLLCVGAVALFVSTVVELPYRAGWSGVAGTVSLVSCQTTGSGRDVHPVCTGVFVPDADNTQARDVTIEGSNSFAAHRTYPARLHSDGATVSVVGAKLVANILAGMSAALMLVVFFDGYFVFVVILTVARRLGRVWRPSKLKGLLPAIVAAVLGLFAIAGAVVGANLSI
jgi:hypothetical protein